MAKTCFLCKKKEAKGFLNSILRRSVRLCNCDWCSSVENKKVFCPDCINHPPKDYTSHLLKSTDQKYAVDFLCSLCFQTYMQDYEKMKVAIRSQKEVEVVPIDDQGQKNTKGESFKIETDYYEDSEEALDELKALARFYDCDIILDTESLKNYEEEENESGDTYRYSTWAYRGTATQRY